MNKKSLFLFAAFMLTHAISSASEQMSTRQIQRIRDEIGIRMIASGKAFERINSQDPLLYNNESTRELYRAIDCMNVAKKMLKKNQAIFPPQEFVYGLESFSRAEAYSQAILKAAFNDRKARK